MRTVELVIFNTDVVSGSIEKRLAYDSAYQRLHFPIAFRTPMLRSCLIVRSESHIADQN